MQTARVVLDIDDPRALINIISPEMVDEMNSHCVTMSQGEGSLTIEIIQDDIRDLRAILNSYLRWLETAKDTQETVRRWKDGDLT